MNLKEMWNEANRIFEENEDTYTFIGIRFENKQRELNEICECSKNNTDREDERDFPEFGTDEYNESATFNGTSAWNLNNNYKVDKDNADKECSRFYPEQDHCYIIVGNYNCNADDGLDDNEVVIEDAKVIAQLF